MSLRWALDAMAVLIVPVAAALVALALPIMRVAAFGQATRAGGVGLLAAGLASLAIGLYTYSAFLLFARAYYALGNSRMPAVVALLSAACGIAVMAAGGAVTSGRATVAFLGFGHSAAYAVGALVLWVGLARRTGHLVVPASLGRSIVAALPIAVGAWAVVQVVDPAGTAGNRAPRGRTRRRRRRPLRLVPPCPRRCPEPAPEDTLGARPDGSRTAGGGARMTTRHRVGAGLALVGALALALSGALGGAAAASAADGGRPVRRVLVFSLPVRLVGRPRHLSTRRTSSTS